MHIRDFKNHMKLVAFLIISLGLISFLGANWMAESAIFLYPLFLLAFMQPQKKAL